MKISILQYNLSVYIIFACNIVLAQSSDSDKLFDVLNTITTPAYVVMGVSSTEITRPSTLRDFTTSVQNVTNGLSTLPNTYGVEFKPWRIKNDVKSDSLKFRETITISFGYNKENVGEDNEFSKAGIGFKCGILKPKSIVNKEKVLQESNIYQALIENKRLSEAKVQQSSQQIRTAISIQENQIIQRENNIQKIQFSNLPQDIEARKLDSISIEKSKNEILRLQTNLAHEVDIAEKSEKLVKARTGKTNLRKSGYFLDLSAGIAWDVTPFNDETIQMAKTGVWVTSGYDITNLLGKSSVSILVAAKNFYEPNMMFITSTGAINYQKSNATDLGGRLILNLFNNKFDVSCEYIHRWRNRDLFKRSDRLVFNASYDFGKDFKLALTFGKDFDNNEMTNGNVISIINFVKSLGQL